MKTVEIRTIKDPQQPIRGEYIDCMECGSENFVKYATEGFTCMECGVKNNKIILSSFYGEFGGLK